MRIETKIFGTVEITDDKIITFENGIIGFPELKHFTLLHDDEAGTDAGIRFLQSMEEPGFAMPVMDPLIVKQDYDPVVEDELLAGIGELNENNLLVMVTVTVPSDLTKMSVNLNYRSIFSLWQFISFNNWIKDSLDVIYSETTPTKHLACIIK